MCGVCKGNESCSNGTNKSKLRMRKKLLAKRFKKIEEKARKTHKMASKVVLGDLQEEADP